VVLHLSQEQLVLLQLPTFANPQQLARAQLVKFVLVLLLVLTLLVPLFVMELVQLLASFAMPIPLLQELQFASACQILA